MEEGNFYLQKMIQDLANTQFFPVVGLIHAYDHKY